MYQSDLLHTLRHIAPSLTRANQGLLIFSAIRDLASSETRFDILLSTFSVAALLVRIEPFFFGSSAPSGEPGGDDEAIAHIAHVFLLPLAHVRGQTPGVIASSASKNMGGALALLSERRSVCFHFF